MSKYGVISGSYFPIFGLNMEIQFEYRKIRTRNNSVVGHFSRSHRYCVTFMNNRFRRFRVDNALTAIDAIKKWRRSFKYYCSVLYQFTICLCSATLLKRRLRYRCFSVNFEKFLRTPFLQNTSRRLLLNG